MSTSMRSSMPSIFAVGLSSPPTRRTAAFTDCGGWSTGAEELSRDGREHAVHLHRLHRWIGAQPGHLSVGQFGGEPTDLIPDLGRCDTIGRRHPGGSSPSFTITTYDLVPAPACAGAAAAVRCR